MAGASAVAKVEDDGRDFIASKTWQGSKPGYYFGTSSHEGTGYYRDTYQQQQLENDDGQQKKRKRTVQIAEDQNEMRILRPEHLLEQAEQKAKGSTVIELTPKGLRSATNSLEKAVTQNAMQRAQHANEPEQYMESELQLYEHVTSLQAIAANIDLYQHLLDKDTLLGLLVQLLGHENIDVGASVISLFYEWIDPALFTEAQDSDPKNLLPILTRLASRILQDSWETIVANLVRFQPPTEGDDQDDNNLKGTENVLSLMENLLEIDLLTPGGLLGNGDDEDSSGNTLSAAAYMVKETKIVSWLFLQIDDSESTTTEFQGRCLELLAIVAQREDVHTILPDFNNLAPYTSMFQEDDDEKDGPTSTKKKKQEPTIIQGMELLLQAIGKFRKLQPANDSQVEYLENACIVVSSCLTFSTTCNLQAFLKGQGIELVLRCLKERVHAGGSALKLLDFFGSEQVHKQACEHLVQAGGLKYILPIFMGTRIPKPAPLLQANSRKVKREWSHLVETQTIRVLYALTRHLDDSSPHDAKVRLTAKFLQDDDSKCDRLVESILAYDQKARKAEYNFYRSDVEDQVEEEETIQLAALDAKLKGGGEVFHRLGAIAAFLCVSSKRCHERILSQLQLQQSGISVVKAALEEFVSVLGPGAQKEQLQSYLSQI